MYRILITYGSLDEAIELIEENDIHCDLDVYNRILIEALDLFDVTNLLDDAGFDYEII